MKDYCFIIAEAGVNHNGDLDLALELVDIAAQSGADAVKFQTFKAAQLVSHEAATAEYQNKNTGQVDQASMLSQLEMSEEMHHAIIARCQQKNIEFMSTAFDIDSLNFLLQHGMQRIKIPSGEITNIPLIREIARKDVPIILSTGMSNLSEIADAVKAISDTRVKMGWQQPLSEILTVLHCTSNYPAKPCDVNLRAMATIAKELNIPVGYSDHTLGVAVSTGAVAMGATVIEKHFTKDRSLPGPDQAASLEPAELSILVEQIRVISKALGSSEKRPTESELPVRELVRRSVAVNKNLCKGDTLSSDDLVLLRPATGIKPSEQELVAGKVLRRDISSASILKWEDLND
ncbi:N-acetylneuraminate synthase [Planctobacterium marinum]|uniref:N-acetylneuraminate synthase n=1 Tax=Planctobacterium marinum TaxID=1631968 RepID=UPI001E383D54|nr:N-acetylneuraminate synthase [Planctobacterium marinum]MCC2606128.1 N-acetylneuraminate synthase [Planctobacterium marinum]